MADNRSKQQLYWELSKKLQQALQGGPTGARRVVHRFSQPGDITQQTTPVVQSPQYPGQAPSIMPLRNSPKMGLDMGFNPQELINTIMQAQQEKKKGLQLQLFLKNLLPQMQGSYKGGNFKAGPFIRPGREPMKPNVGAEFKGGFSF